MLEDDTFSQTTRHIQQDSDNFKHLIAVLIAIVTVIAAVVAYLQSDASSLDERANRDSKRYALEALGRKVGGDARVNYDYNTAYVNWLEINVLRDSAQSQDDLKAAARYQKLANHIASVSPLLSPPYFDPANEQVDISLYESDTYLIEVTRLMEQFDAASAVKDAWDYKANTYIVHLTLLAVSLFLFGLSTTISAGKSRWIFVGLGGVLTCITVGWMVWLYSMPVFDLRAVPGAIDAYARGVGLMNQERWTEAISSLDEAIKASPEYTNAYAQRADAYATEKNHEAAAADYETALAFGSNAISVVKGLGWQYYLLGKFDRAIAMRRAALERWPDDTELHFDLGLMWLASGDPDAAQAEYRHGMDVATREVAVARSSGSEPPYQLWWSLDDAALQLDNLLFVLDKGQGTPPPNSIVNPDGARPVAKALIQQLKSLSVALEFTGKPPEGKLEAQISPFDFGIPVNDDEGEITDYKSLDAFADETQEVAVHFDYSNMRDGQEVIYKLYIDGEEDPSWRIIEVWEDGPKGSLLFALSLAYTESFIFDPGKYTLEMYVDSHLAQRGTFTIANETSLDE